MSAQFLRLVLTIDYALDKLFLVGPTEYALFVVRPTKSQPTDLSCQKLINICRVKTRWNNVRMDCCGGPNLESFRLMRLCVWTVGE